MPPTLVHIINHTHWDREWFLTSIYTSQWIAGLIDKIEELAALNPDFKFLLDGQTLVIEDLLQVAPDYEAKVKRLVESGHLIIGPYYCQPDWQLTSGEALVRNLLFGRQDMQRFGGRNEVGWLVDTFGHIAQGPQLHRLFGVWAVYVWRGVPDMVPYFLWEGSDGQPLFTINLFGGYRNLYGVTHAPDVAVRRLQAEVEKLAPHYPTAHIPLFDGYDLEEEPEDPMSFYRQEVVDLPAELRLEESSPEEFARLMRGKLDQLPVIQGELNSGKFGAIFPGTFSARTYLKIMHHDCEQGLYQRAEPLGVLARLKGRPYNATQYEGWARLLLQNAVHDCICGVSIDQVHEKMELHYRAIWSGLLEDIKESLDYLLGDFAPGLYAVSTSPFSHEDWQVYQNMLYTVRTGGIGIWRLGEAVPVEQTDEPVASFEWHNEHYSAVVHPDGVVQIGDGRLGQLVLVEEQGDTYSEERGEDQTVCRPSEALIIEQKSERHCVLRYECELSWKQVHLTAVVRLRFDPSPLVRWQVELDSRGTNFRVEMVFQTGQTGRVYAGMPFDMVQRETADTDLLPRRLEQGLANVLLGQRELEVVNTFPFHDFVAISNDESSAVVLAKGLRAYRADEGGHLILTLRRSVEWLTAADLPHRVGDAGPFFYVPDARAERTVSHELAAYIGVGGADEIDIYRLNASFQNPPLIVEAEANGENTEWLYLQETLPLSALHQLNGHLQARFFNPTTRRRPFAQPHPATDVWGKREAIVDALDPKQIVTVALPHALPEPRTGAAPHVVRAIEGMAWRVGENHGEPDPAIIEQLQERISRLEESLAALEQQMARATGRERYLLEHQYYVHKRELFEFRLSVRLNELKLESGGELSTAYLFTSDEEVANIGRGLNRLRIKRRIYDYIVAALGATEL